MWNLSDWPPKSLAWTSRIIVATAAGVGYRDALVLEYALISQILQDDASLRTLAASPGSVRLAKKTYGHVFSHLLLKVVDGVINLFSRLAHYGISHRHS